VTRHDVSWATALAAGLLLALTGCGGSGTAAAGKPTSTVPLGEQVQDLAGQVEEMGIVEWHGQLLTKNPDKGGKRVLDLSGRFSPSTGYSEITMESSLEGDVQLVDYLVVADRAYFNSDVWGPDAAGCWVDITGDAARTWGLPTDLNPGWPLSAARPVARDGDDVTVTIPFDEVIDGMPRGLFPSVPDVPNDVEAKAVIAPHGHLIEVGVDVQSMWNKLPEDQRAAVDHRGAGWWAMTMKRAGNDASIAPPQHLFDPAVTPPSQCKRA
jgi:hypothetical protein